MELGITKNKNDGSAWSRPEAQVVENGGRYF